ncbi:MAG TPA: hypothetical protein VJG29_00100 [Candidatus Paceibacterota bacterium]
MSRKSIFSIWIVAAFFVGFFHTLSLSYYLYWLVPWTDFAIHLLGGVVVFIPFYLLYRERKSVWIACGAALLSLFAVDVAWEIFEFVQGLTVMEPGFWPDTISDTVASCVGAFLAFLLLEGGKKRNAE